MDTPKAPAQPAVFGLDELAKYLVSCARRIYDFTNHGCLNRDGFNVRDNAFGKSLVTFNTGDLVVEMTAYHKPQLDRVGKFVSLEDWAYDYPDWDEEYEGRPIPTRPVYTILTLDGRTMTWDNCQFIALPRDPYTPEQFP
jgi:hypothetical protein